MSRQIKGSKPMTAGTFRRMFRLILVFLLTSTIIVALYASALRLAAGYFESSPSPFSDIHFVQGQSKLELMQLLDDRHVRRAGELPLDNEQLVYVEGEHRLVLSFIDDRLTSWSVSGPLVVRRVETSGEFNLCCGATHDQSPKKGD
jgi:hypothetical protein